MAWICLVIAAVFEVAWTYSLKYLDMSRLKKIQIQQLFSDKQQFYTLLPFTGYIVFGLANIYFFSKAMKQIPAATAMATWMALVLVGIKIVDASLFHEPLRLSQSIFILLIIIGIAGLKLIDQS